MKPTVWAPSLSCLTGRFAAEGRMWWDDAMTVQTASIQQAESDAGKQGCAQGCWSEPSELLVAGRVPRAHLLCAGLHRATQRWFPQPQGTHRVWCPGQMGASALGMEEGCWRAWSHRQCRVAAAVGKAGSWCLLSGLVILEQKLARNVVDCLTLEMFKILLDKALIY